MEYFTLHQCAHSRLDLIVLPCTGWWSSCRERNREVGREVSLPNRSSLLLFSLMQSLLLLDGLLHLEHLLLLPLQLSSEFVYDGVVWPLCLLISSFQHC